MDKTYLQKDTLVYAAGLLTAMQAGYFSTTRHAFLQKSGLSDEAVLQELRTIGRKTRTVKADPVMLQDIDAVFPQIRDAVEKGFDRDTKISGVQNNLERREILVFDIADKENFCEKWNLYHLEICQIDHRHLTGDRKHEKSLVIKAESRNCYLDIGLKFNENAELYQLKIPDNIATKSTTASAVSYAYENGAIKRVQKDSLDF